MMVLLVTASGRRLLRRSVLADARQREIALVCIHIQKQLTVVIETIKVLLEEIQCDCFALRRVEEVWPLGRQLMCGQLYAIYIRITSMVFNSNIMVTLNMFIHTSIHIRERTYTYEFTFGVDDIVMRGK